MIRRLLILLEKIVCRLPWRRAQALGGLLGLVWYHGIPIRRGTVRANLARSMPTLSGGERSRIAREHYRHLGTSALEFLWASGRGPSGLEEWLVEEGLDHYRDALAKGKGVIAVTGHFGNWDLAALVQAGRGVPLHVVTKTLKQHGVNRYWMDRRAAAGICFLGDRGSLKGIVSALRRNQVVGLVIDQRTPASQGGALVDFLGRPAWTSTAAAVLALRTGAVLLPAYSHRTGDGRHVLEVGPPVDVAGLDSRTGVPELTRRLNADLEARILKHPEQWLWLHRRWRDAGG